MAEPASVFAFRCARGKDWYSPRQPITIITEIENTTTYPLAYLWRGWQLTDGTSINRTDQFPKIREIVVPARGTTVIEIEIPGLERYMAPLHLTLLSPALQSLGSWGIGPSD